MKRILIIKHQTHFARDIDHGVSFYDLRFPKEPVRLFEGHKKAVSYVKWLNNEEIVST